MHKRLYDRQRADDPIRVLYRSKRWQRTRRIVIARDVLCRACGHKAGTDVDHIVSARVIVERFGVEEFYNPDRCQLLCHGCHAKKTATESGWAGSKTVTSAASSEP